jgi:hypothetical protein
MSGRFKGIQSSVSPFPQRESWNSARTCAISPLTCDFSFRAHDIQPRVNEIPPLNGRFSQSRLDFPSATQPFSGLASTFPLGKPEFHRLGRVIPSPVHCFPRRDGEKQIVSHHLHRPVRHLPRHSPRDTRRNVIRTVPAVGDTPGYGSPTLADGTFTRADPNVTSSAEGTTAGHR